MPAVRIFFALAAALILCGCSFHPFGLWQKGADETEVVIASPEPEGESFGTAENSISTEMPGDDETAAPAGEPRDFGGAAEDSSESFSFPEYTGEPYVVLNNNVPDFTEEELASLSGENYSEQDSLGRCGPAAARLERSMMPSEERGEIGEIRPSGWNQAKYPGLVDSDPPFLYNRCHLIAYGLTGQNANEKNLITGTRYLNVEGMLPFERQTIYYLHRPGVHVLYRVTPRFYGDELVARGVEMEAYSVEDGGAGLSFHVYVFNVQPGVEIDYADGSSRRSGE